MNVLKDDAFKAFFIFMVFLTLIVGFTEGAILAWKWFFIVSLCLGILSESIRFFEYLHQS